MMENDGKSGPGHAPMTGLQILAAALVLAIMLVPLVLLAVVPKNPVVNFLFGDGRVFVVWLIYFVFVLVFGGSLDRLHKRAQKKRNRENH